MLRNLFRHDLTSSDNESDSDSDILQSTKSAESKIINFRCSSYVKPSISQENSLFVIDTEEVEPIDNEPDVSKLKEQPLILKPTTDPEILKILEKSVVKPGFDQKPAEEIVAKSMRQLKRERKIQSEKTKGQDWFDLPATELTEEKQRDLEIIRMRDAIDPKTHYRKEDTTQKLPKYFQVGHIVEGKADFYSSRLTKKERKRTLVEEILHDQDLMAKNKKRYTDIKAREAITKRGSFQRRGGLSKRSKHIKQKQK